LRALYDQPVELVATAAQLVDRRLSWLGLVMVAAGAATAVTDVATTMAVATHHRHHHQRAGENEQQQDRGVHESALGFVGGRCASRTAMKMTAPRTTSQKPIIRVIQSQSHPSTQVCMAPPFC